jgi:hypothetical protein
MNTQHAPLRPFAPEVAIENISFAGHAWNSGVLEQIALPYRLSLPGRHPVSSLRDLGGTHSHDESAVSGEPGYYEIIETAGRELLDESAISGPTKSAPDRGARFSHVGARGEGRSTRAWTDPAFRQRPLTNGRAAYEKLGISFYDDTQPIVLETP